MRTRHFPLRLAAALIIAAGLANPAAGDGVAPIGVTMRQVRQNGVAAWTLSLPGQAAFHTTTRQIVAPRVVRIPGSPTGLILWGERSGRQTISMYAVTRDGQQIAGRTRETSYSVRLKFANFDPAVRVPAMAPTLVAPADAQVYLVQFVTPPLPEFAGPIVGAGGEVLAFMPDHVQAIRMDAAARARIAALPFVRWVGPMHTAYKLEDRLITQVVRDALPGGQFKDAAAQKVSIECFRRGPADQQRVAAAIAGAGGTVLTSTPEGFRLVANLTPAQVLAVARLDEVSFIDTWGAPEKDMNRARASEGSDANFIEATLGFTGQGVRGEVMDFGFRKTHNAFKGPDVILHGPEQGAGDDHGTSTFGIVFGNGAANASGRGMAPSRDQGIFASYLNLTENFGTISRYDHTAELVDPEGPYRAVFQSNSWGSQSTTNYTTTSAEFDDILFINDLLTLQSMSNNGNQIARPQAWSKNVVSVGGLFHANNSSRADDIWGEGASIGPAADGRIKPDLAHFFDFVLCPTNSNDNAYTTTFGGTSAATPITAGAFAILFQMWHEGVFSGFGGDSTVFDSRPHMATAKALMINAAHRYDFAGQGADLARIHQGWGMPDLRALYELRDRMVIVNETDVLAPLASISYTIRVPAAEPVLSVTLVYTDPKGATNTDQARVNDLSLRITSPDGQTSYWGNSGLLDGNWSTPGGASNTKDTVENVFIQSPDEGDWTVEVLADEVVQDSHVETMEVDADFALVASGGALVSCYPDCTADDALDLFDFLCFQNAFVQQQPYGDCDQDQVWDLFDFLCFQNLFAAGCE
jgi:serine protease AprX